MKMESGKSFIWIDFWLNQARGWFHVYTDVRLGHILTLVHDFGCFDGVRFLKLKFIHGSLGFDSFKVRSWWIEWINSWYYNYVWLVMHVYKIIIVHLIINDWHHLLYSLKWIVHIRGGKFEVCYVQTQNLSVLIGTDSLLYVNKIS